MSPTFSSIALESYDVHPKRGYLPATDPLPCLSEPFAAWEEAAKTLPKLLVSDQIHALLESLPPFPTLKLQGERELRRAMMLLSYIGHAYVWGGKEPGSRLPAVIAAPWFRVASQLGRPPVLSYASYALDNWFRIEAEGEIALGNIALLQNFLGGIDEEWFILIHVDIEAKAGPALAALVAAQQAAIENQPEEVERQLRLVEAAQSAMYATLARVPEHCDPYIYYHRVRPYIHGWKNNPALPEGVLYEGVEAFEGKPQFFRGETGAQSSIIPALDAVLGVTHADDPLKAYLLEMRDYMPERHRAFLAALEARPSLRTYLTGQANVPASLHALYNQCVTWVERFRSLHLEYAATYIHRQAQKEASNPSSVGTGGTPFMTYLKKHRDETADQKV